MGSIFKSKPPASLLEQLLAAAESPPKMTQLCRDHRAEILEQFPGWRSVPAEIRADQRALQRYGNGLMAIARCFEQQLGEPTLLHSLLAPPPGGAGEAAQVAALNRAQGLLQQFKYREACTILDEALQNSQEYRPHILGLLAQALFMGGGPLDQPQKLLEEALALCTQRGDGEGVVAYVGSLYELFRYGGNNSQAQAMAENLSRLLARSSPAQARYYASQARLLVKGEPLNRIQARLGAARYEIEDVPVPLKGSLQLSYERNRITLAPAEALLEQGKQLGARGELEQALEAFQAAASLDRYDPDPHYQMGFAYLQSGRYQQALEACQKTEALAPGWFSCRSDGWLAQELVEGRMDGATFRELTLLDDGGDPPQVRLEMARKLQNRAGGLGLFHLHCGQALRQLGQTQEAIAAFRRGLESRLEDEVKTRILAAWATAEMDRGRRRELFQQAWQVNGHLFSAASARIALRSEP